MALFVGRLSFDCTSRDLEDHFHKFGTIDKCEVKHGRGFGFVTFRDKRDAEDAIYDLNGTHFFQTYRLITKGPILWEEESL